MTSKFDFSEDEWTRLKRAPFIAGMAISLADPGGPIEAFKETAATLNTVRDAGESGGRGELIGAIAQEVVADAGQRRNPSSDGFKPRGALAGQEIIEELAEVNRIVSAKATPRRLTPFGIGSRRQLRRPRTPPRREASWAFTPNV